MSAPNIGEKIAATYLRLNGFLLLHHFTVFIDERPRHIDLLGLRAAHSAERPFGNEPCIVDDELFAQIKNAFKVDEPKGTCLGAVVEVRTNEHVDYPQKKYCDYAKSFLGSSQLISLAFARNSQKFTFEKETLVVHLDYTLDWILKRIDHMENKLRVRKTESWFLSDEFLADILILRRLGFPRR